MELFNFNNVNSETLQTLQGIFPDGWFDDVRQFYGDESLSDEMISQSVEETCDFFHIDEPAIVSEGWTTGVYPNNDFTLQDDVLIFNREQLLDMGISGKDGLDLVMTHEGTHRVLQGMEYLGFDSHQEELCCDYMAGVRAGLNNIDVSQMENSLLYTPESESHPVGTERVQSIEAGVRFAQEYYAEYNMPPSFDECLENFKTSETYTNTLDHPHSEHISFHGYTQDEINRKMAHAKSEQSRYESLARHNMSMAKNGLSEANTDYHLKQAEIFQKRAAECKSDYQKWKYTKPDA